MEVRNRQQGRIRRDRHGLDGDRLTRAGSRDKRQVGHVTLLFRIERTEAPVAWLARGVPDTLLTRNGPWSILWPGFRQVP